MRVYELAKEYDKKSTDFLDIIREFGINVKSHLSTLDDDRVTEIRNKLDTRQVSIDLENDLLERSIGVKEPLEDSDRDDEETDTDLSFGQKAFAKAEDPTKGAKYVEWYDRMAQEEAEHLNSIKRQTWNTGGRVGQEPKYVSAQDVKNVYKILEL